MFFEKEDFPTVRIHLEENVFLQSWNATQCKGYKLHNHNEVQALFGTNGARKGMHCAVQELIHITQVQRVQTALWSKNPE